MDKKITTKKIWDTESKLKSELMYCLNQFSNIRLIGDNNAVGIISCTFENYSPDEIGKILKEKQIVVRTGLHCSPLAHQVMGTFPLGTFSTIEEIKELESALIYMYAKNLIMSWMNWKIVIYHNKLVKF